MDYPVSQTVIYPDYHNNKEELAKIESTIDSVKFDSDVTITSIHIKDLPRLKVHMTIIQDWQKVVQKL